MSFFVRRYLFKKELLPLKEIKSFFPDAGKHGQIEPAKNGPKKCTTHTNYLSF